MKNTLVAFGALCAFAALCVSAVFAQDSPKQAMREVPFVNVKLDDNFWTPRKLTSATVYWFDDEANGGGRRVPAAWKLTYYDARLAKRLDVEAQDAYALDKDRDVVVNFKEIEASTIRINAQLKPGYSSGILRWVVK